MASRTAVLAALLLAGGCASAAPPGETPLPPGTATEEWPWPIVPSADGRYRLRMGPFQWTEDGDAPGGLRLDVQGTVEPWDASLLLGWADPLAALVAADGAPAIPAPHGWTTHSAWGNFSRHSLGVDPATTRLERICFEVPVLRVRTWEAHAFPGVGMGRTEDLEAPPFTLTVTGEEFLCHVAAGQGDGPGERTAPLAEIGSLLLHRWAAMAAEVTDARGRPLHCIGGAGSGGSTVGMYALELPGSEAAEEDSPIAWPVTVVLRVPKEYGVERVRFEVRDVVLPPRPAPLPRAVAIVEPVGPEYDPTPAPAGDAAWSAWTAPEGGLSARFAFPRRVARGTRVSTGLALRFDPADLPEEVTHFDGFGLERGVRLLLRHPASGEALAIPAVDPLDGPPIPERSAEWEEEGLCSPIGEGGLREFQVWFPLAAEWNGVRPGTWEACVTAQIARPPLDPPGGLDGAAAPVPWTGAFTTGTVTIVVEEAPVRTVRLRVPTTLRVLPVFGAAGGLGIACREEDREVVEVETRHGLLLGATVRRDGSPGVEHVGGTRIDVADSLPHGHEGPFRGTYEIEVFETGEEPRYHVGVDPAHPTYRTLWKRAFTVEATAEEIEGLRR